MIKQDIIKAREELTASIVVQKGRDFARTYKAIREVLAAMVNGQTDLIKNNIKLPWYVMLKFRELGIAVLQMPSYARFRLTTLGKDEE